jgi:tetratricopeptide (TPR) repeat protein
MLKDTDQAERMTRDAGDIRTLQDVMAAIEDTRKDIQQRPDDARLYGKLGDLYRRAENYQEARKAYEQAIASDETNPHWRFKIDDLEIWKKGRELAELARKVRAGDAAAKQALEQGRAELLDFRLKSFLEREKQYSTDSRIRYELGMIFFELAEGKDDKALFDQAIQRFQIIYPDPNYRHEAGLRMGIGFARKGQFDLALKRFDEVIGPMEIKDLRWKNLVYAKADTLERAGRKEDALKTFLQIYEIDVGFKDVSDRVDKLHKEGVSMA